jgi:hypothetical protein
MSGQRRLVATRRSGTNEVVEQDPRTAGFISRCVLHEICDGDIACV